MLFIKNYISEPFYIYGEGEYNINGVRELKVTDSFMTLMPHVRNCQIKGKKENDDCVRLLHRERMLSKC